MPITIGMHSIAFVCGTTFVVDRVPFFKSIRKLKNYLV
jgi:hypothetical protein